MRLTSCERHSNGEWWHAVPKCERERKRVEGGCDPMNAELSNFCVDFHESNDDIDSLSCARNDNYKKFIIPFQTLRFDGNEKFCTTKCSIVIDCSANAPPLLAFPIFPIFDIIFRSSRKFYWSKSGEMG